MSFDFSKAIVDTGAHVQPQNNNEQTQQEHQESLWSTLTGTLSTLHKTACNYSYQAFATYLFISSLLAVYPITSGLAFLEKSPNNFMCERFTSKKMSSSLQDHRTAWHSCHRQEVCAEKLPHDRYRVANESDPEYFQNWVQKLDILCTPQAELGFIGTAFFVGVIIAVFTVPSACDKYGRRVFFVGTLMVQLIGMVGLCFATSLGSACFCVFLLGLSHPAKNIVAFNYCLELLPEKVRSTVVNCILLLEAGMILPIAACYQFVDRSWHTLHFMSLCVTSINTVLAYFCLSESAKFFHTQGKFAESRAVLDMVTRFNKCSSWFDSLQIASEFQSAMEKEDALPSLTDSTTTQKQQEHAAQADDVEEAGKENANLLRNNSDEEIETEQSGTSEEQSVSVKEKLADPDAVTNSDEIISEQSAAPVMTPSQFACNIAKMAVMWSASSFSGYLLNFMNKYLEGSIYTNNYNEGIAGILATVGGAQIFAKLGLRWTFVTSFGMALLGATIVYGLESNTIVLPDWFLLSFVNGNTAPKMHKLAVKRALDYLVPKVTFIAKFGVNLGFVSTYQASFSRDDIFPSDRRATAIGYCQLVGRAVTALAPEVTELQKPKPIGCLCIITAVAFLVSFSFPSEDEAEALNQRKEKKSENQESKKQS